MINLGKLKEIKDLRKVWPHEALDFTPWLAEEDNLTLLADAVGLAITVDETESGVGDFNVDIYATETGTDRKIIIENQQRLKQVIPALGSCFAQGWNHFFFYPNLSTWASGTPPGGVADTLLLKNRSEDMLLLKFCK
mgnify:CR=1 FL=1